MTATVGFVVFLFVTLGFLGGVVVTGMKAKRRLHIPLVVLAVASLGVTIFYAEQLGREYDLESAGWITPVHIALAKITTLGYLLPIATGIATLRDGRRRPLHRKFAFLILALTVVTAVTGTSMVLLSDPL